MKSIISIVSLFVMSVILFCASPNDAFAQNDDSAFQPIQPAATYDWKHDSAVYKKWGWGLFGSGLALDAIGIGLAAGLNNQCPPRDEHCDCSPRDEHCDIGIMGAISGVFLFTFGSAALFSGIGTLIAEAVKFNPYRDGDPEAMANAANPLWWEHESTVYKAWGWSLFGVGLTSSAIGIALFTTDNEKINGDIPGFVLMAVGGGMLVTGIGTLIADAVKFSSYRNQSAGFTWSPEVYFSPEMTGLGISGRF